MSLLVLASSSPRRLELLHQVGFQATVMPADIDESAYEGESVDELVERLAISKAQKVVDLIAGDSSFHLQTVVLAADTMVVLDGQLLGKPADREDALQMLALLSGRTHQVATGVCVNKGGKFQSKVVHTDVQMGDFSASAAAQYWDTGEPAGKAGSYALQGQGAAFVQMVTGSYSNVIGLPLYETVQMLREAGLELFNQRSGTRV